MMKIAIMIFLTTLNSCNTVRPYIKPIERCGYSVQFDKCRCISYSLYEAEKIGEGYDMPAEYCDDIIGFKVENWLKDITPWAKLNIRLYNDRARK